MHSNTPSNERAGCGIKAATIGALLFLHLPLTVLILYAFTTEDASFTFPPPGLTLRWFDVTFHRSDFWDALTLSLRAAGVTTLLALILGTLSSLALYRTRFFGRDTISLLIILPIALPGIVTGIALRSAISLSDIEFSFWMIIVGRVTINFDGINFGFWTIVLGHTTFTIVTVYNNVIARLRRTAYSQIEASMDLGATSFQTFRYVVLPHIASALLAGGMLAFALSFDEVIVTTFTAGQQQTLPIWIFSQLVRPRDRPVTNVAALFVIATTFIPILLAYRYTYRVRE